jgi:(2Fe-2S) ferredoxin
MELPNVATEVRDEPNQVTYRVMAYRKLTPDEAVRFVQLHLRRAKRKARRGSVVTIITTVD